MIESLFGFASPTYYRWKKEKRPIVELIEKSFSEKELQLFLETGNIPHKIEWANRNIQSLYDSFSRYLVFNEGVKALLSAIKNNNLNINEIDSYIVKEFQCGNIDEYDMIQYFNNKPSQDILMYLFENKNSNWTLYKETVMQNNNLWLAVYLDIVLISIEKGIYDVTFSNTNKNNDYGIVPPPPKLFTYYTNYQKIEEKYYNLLTQIYSSIQKNTYKSLELYYFYDTFDLNTFPIDYNGEKLTLNNVKEFVKNRNI